MNDAQTRRPPGLSGVAIGPHGWYLTVGACVLFVGALLPPGIRMWAYMAVACSVLVAIAVGVRRHRPVWPAPWWLLAAGVGMSLLANAGWAMAMTPSGVPRFPSFGDLCFATTMVLIAASVYRWVRPDRHRGGGIDAGIVALGGGAVSWVFVIAPLLFDGPFHGLRLASSLFYAAMDLLILVLTVRVVVVSRVRTPAYRLMISAAGLMVVTDTVYSATLIAGNALDTITALGWLGTYLLIGTAALHPSMGRSTGSMPGNPSVASRWRLLTYVSLTVAISALSVLGVTTALSGTQSLRLIVLLAVGCAASVLLIARLAQLAALLNRRVHLDALTGLGNRAALQAHLGRASGSLTACCWWSTSTASATSTTPSATRPATPP